MAVAKTWDGSAWVQAPVKIWTQEEEEPGRWGEVIPKEWDGAFWVQEGGVGGNVITQFAGAVDTDSFQVSLYTENLFKVRIKVTETDDTPVTDTGEINIPSYNMVKIPISGLAHSTEYKYRPQILSGDGEWVDAGVEGRIKTLIPLGTTAYSYKIAMHGCQVSNSPRTDAFDDILDWEPDWHLNGGDWHYVNETSLKVDKHRKNWMNALLNPGYASIYPQIGLLHYSRSDHDGGGGQSAAIQHPSTTPNMQAYHEVIPHRPMAQFILQPEALCTSFGIGDVLFICTDIRTLARSDAEDPETEDKTALGEEQTEWVLEQLAREDYPIKALITDCPWPGALVDIGDKMDHWARYTTNRQIIADAMEEVDGFIVQFDYHGLVGSDAVDPSGWPLLGCAGSDRSSSLNIRDPENYDYVFGVENNPIAVWGKVEITRVGNQVTVTMTGRNALDLQDEFEVEKIFTV